MRSLLKPRVNTLKYSFATAGVNCAGSVQLRKNRNNGPRHLSKKYFAVIVYFSTWKLLANFQQKGF